MNPALLSILELLTSEKPSLREEAVLQIAMILEKHSDAPNEGAFYQGILREELKDLLLSYEEQFYVANHLSSIIKNGKGDFDLIWALGKAKRAIAFPLLISSIDSQSSNFDEEFVWEALNALNKFIAVSSDDVDLEAQQELLLGSHIEIWLAKIERVGSPRNQEKAKGLMAKIDAARPQL